MPSLYNLARMTSTTTGSSTLTLGSAVSGFLSFSGAGVQNSQSVYYAINDPGDSPVASEFGIGTYSSGTLARSVLMGTAGSTTPITCTGNQHVFITGGAESIRERLTANRTYYVRSDGSDSNNGLANTSTSAFLTLQKVVTVCNQIDFNGYGVVAQLGSSGTYPGFTVSTLFPGQVGSSNFYILGDTSTANVNNYILSSAITVNTHGTVAYAGLRIVGSNGIGVTAVQFGRAVQLGYVVYASTSQQIQAQQHGRVTLSSNFEIDSDCSIAVNTANNGIFVANNVSALMNGSTYAAGMPTWGTAFLQVSAAGSANMIGFGYTSSAVGTRFNLISNGVLNTNGAGSTAAGNTYLPGNAAGSAATGGVVV